MDVKLVGQAIDCIDPEDMDAGIRPDVATGLGQYDRAVHGLVGALAVICLEITHVSGGLVDIGPIGVTATFELENKDGTAHQQNHVRTAKLEWKLVLEDCGVVRRPSPPGGLR